MSKQVANAFSDNAALVSGEGWQQYQNIYHQITRKRERLTKRYTTQSQYTLHDIEDLHYKINQIAAAHIIKASNHNVTVVYDNKSTTTFSSFERFQVQAKSGSTAVKTIVLEYNFAIQGSVTEEVNQHKVSVELFSGVAIFADIQREVPKQFWCEIGFPSCLATIEFVDYVIAQNIQFAITHWHEAVTKAPQNKIQNFARKYSGYLPSVASIATLMLLSGLFYKLAENLNLDSNIALARYLVSAGMLAYLLNAVGRFIGSALESSVDQIWDLAYIHLNHGDEKLIQKVRGHNKSCFIAIAVKCGIYFVLLVISTMVSGIIDGVVFK
jgi:hypothetical protein